MIKKLALGGLAALVALVLAQAIGTRSVASSTSKTVSSPTLQVSAPETLVKPNKKTIKQLEVDATRAVFIVGPIMDMNAVVAQIYALDRANSSARISIVLDSPGGSILEGAKVISAIEGVRAPVDTICTELCASMAAMIHSYGAQRYITDHSLLMYHDWAGGFQGDGSHIGSLYAAVARFVKRMNAHISERSGIPLEKLEIGELKQIWVDSEDATDQGFNDAIVSPDIAALFPKDAVASEKLKQQFQHATEQYQELRNAR